MIFDIIVSAEGISATIPRIPSVISDIVGNAGGAVVVVMTSSTFGSSAASTVLTKGSYTVEDVVTRTYN